MIRFSAWLAVVCGVVVAMLQAAVGESWPWRFEFPIEYIAAALLLLSGALMIFKISPGRRVLAGAWGFTGGVAAVRFFSALSLVGFETPAGQVAASSVVAAEGALFCLAAVGFAFSLVPQGRKSSHRVVQKRHPVDHPGSLVPDAGINLPAVQHAASSVVVARDRGLPQAVNGHHRPDRVDRAARA